MDLKREILPSRRSTRLSDIEQLDRTLYYSLNKMGGEFGLAVIGVIRQSTRLFNTGDIVTLFLNNGGGERWPVWAISSKGYVVRGMYMHFQACYWPLRSHCWQTFPRRVGLIPEGPDQFVPARRVLDEWQADPTRQREIVDTLRTAVVARR